MNRFLQPETISKNKKKVEIFAHKKARVEFTRALMLFKLLSAFCLKPFAFSLQSRHVLQQVNQFVRVTPLVIVP